MPSSASFRKKVYGYYAKNGRNLPWRHTHDPYNIFVSEIMLQQTQVDRVIPKYQEFIKKYPNFNALANAPLSDVLHLWQGLGYNRRAMALKRAAEEVVRLYSAKLPEDYTKLLNLPGVGQYTAAAVLIFAFNKGLSTIETNIRSVFIENFFNTHKRKVSDKEIAKIARKTLDKKNPRKWHWALMDYGAALKKIGKGANDRARSYRKQPSFKGSRRELRGKIITQLLASKGRGKREKEIAEIIGVSQIQISTVLKTLVNEGLLKKHRNVYTIAD